MENVFQFYLKAYSFCLISLDIFKQSSLNSPHLPCRDLQLLHNTFDVCLGHFDLQLKTLPWIKPP